MKRILIILSTYNGSKFLPEQLNSLYRQKNVDIHILVRDDGSKDNTIDILTEYKNKFGRMTIYAESNVGVHRSFHKLMGYASDKFPDFDYYSFCDQDDVWLEDKLYVATQLLGDKVNALYYCNAFITNSKLEIISDIGIQEQICLQYVIFRQPALGCTQVMTNSFFKTCANLSKKYLSCNPSGIVIHDYFTILISQMTETHVIADKAAHILYRQHGNNVTKHTREKIRHKIQRVNKRLKQQSGIKYTCFQILCKFLEDRLTNNASNLYYRMQNYQNSILKTLSFAWYMQHYYSKLNIKLYVLYCITKRLL